MDMHSVRDLLPFYVNGTLTPEERRLVDEALAASEELHEDLLFWQRAASTLHEAQGHLTAARIVERAQGRTPNSDRAAQDRHLEVCPDCRDLLERTAGSLSTPAETGSSSPRSRNRKGIWMYAAAAVFVAAIVLVVAHDAPPHDSQQPHLQPNPEAGITSPIAIRSITLIYRPVMRSSNHRQPAHVALRGLDSLVLVRFIIPQSSVDEIRYTLRVEREGGSKTIIGEGIGRSGHGKINDTLAVTVTRRDLPAPRHRLRYIVREEMPPDASGMTPEEYIFDIIGESVP